MKTLWLCCMVAVIVALSPFAALSEEPAPVPAPVTPPPVATPPADAPAKATPTPATTADAPPAPPAIPWVKPEYRRGVNIAGAEFGSGLGKLHKDYTFNEEAAYAYFAGKGFTLFRVPIKWERLQPVLNGPLEKEYLGGLKKNIEWAKKYNGYVLIDLHNYGRYKCDVDGKPQGCIIDSEYAGKVRVSSADLADVWKKLSDEFKADETVYAYGLMNEPHDMGKSSWKAISNVVVKALRDHGDTKLIFVAGDGYSNANGWEKRHGAESWVTDPANNFVYEAHCYFDEYNSGQYKLTYDQELKKNKNLPLVGKKRVAGFVAWCKKNNVRGFLGEFGVPKDDPRWLEVLDHFLTELDEGGIGGTYWAAGNYWGGYPLSIHPDKKYKEDKPQLAVMLKHNTGAIARKPMPVESAPVTEKPAEPKPATEPAPATPAPAELPK